MKNTENSEQGFHHDNLGRQISTWKSNYKLLSVVICFRKKLLAFKPFQSQIFEGIRLHTERFHKPELEARKPVKKRGLRGPIKVPHSSHIVSKSFLTDETSKTRGSKNLLLKTKKSSWQFGRLSDSDSYLKAAIILRFRCSFICYLQQQQQQK